MKQQISTKLAAQLGHLSQAQLDEITKRALVLRQRANDRSGTLDVWVQRVIKKDERVSARAEDVLEGVVTAVLLHEVMVETVSGVVLARPGIRAVVVGDRVRVGRLEDQWMAIELE